jgi:hypothetical protein
MRVEKRSESGAESRRVAGVLVHHRWRRWAEHARVAALRQPIRLPLALVHARPLQRWMVERLHTASYVVPVQPTIHLHLALAVSNPPQMFVVRPVVAGWVSSDRVSRQPLQPPRGTPVRTSHPATVHQQVQVTHHRSAILDSRHLAVSRLVETHRLRERRVADLIEQVRHRSERMAYEMPARVVHRRAEVAAVRHDQPTNAAPSRTHGPRDWDVEAARRAERPPLQANMPAGLDLHRVTDEVVRQIDRRLIARRERMGQV